MLRPKLEAVVQPDRITVRNLGSGQVATAEGPFSCDHLLIDDVDIFEHVFQRALAEVGCRLWSFPEVTINTDGRRLHTIELGMIQNAVRNAGASRVDLNPAVQALDEQAVARSTYVRHANRKT